MRCHPTSIISKGQTSFILDLFNIYKDRPGGYIWIYSIIVLKRIPKACGPLPGLASALPGAPGPAGAPRYRSIFLAARILFCRCRTTRPAVRDWLSLAPTRSWRGRGALQPPVRGGRGEAGRAAQWPRPVSTSPNPQTAEPAAGPYRNMATS